MANTSPIAVIAAEDITDRRRLPHFPAVIHATWHDTPVVLKHFKATEDIGLVLCELGA